jgi:hypothetical protein
MRVRAAALVCLLAAVGPLSGCGSDDGDTATDRSTATVAPSTPPSASPTAGPSEAPRTPPTIVVTSASGASATTQPGSYCWQSGGAGQCADAVAVDPDKLPVLTGVGPATFDFPVEGWSFTATFRELRDHPLVDDAQVAAQQSEPGRFTVVTPPGSGDFRVDLSGTGPEGDYSAVFRWQVPPEANPQ